MSNEVDGYIAAAPRQAQPHLRELRRIIRAEAPDAQERISYKMPYYRLNGHLVYFACFKDHVSLFPAGHVATEGALSRYIQGKGTYQFPLDEPLPASEIRNLIRARVKENDAKARRTGSASRRAAKPR